MAQEGRVQAVAHVLLVVQCWRSRCGTHYGRAVLLKQLALARPTATATSDTTLSFSPYPAAWHLLATFVLLC
jgi:hypothetical protein